MNGALYMVVNTGTRICKQPTLDTRRLIASLDPHLSLTRLQTLLLVNSSYSYVRTKTAVSRRYLHPSRAYVSYLPIAITLFHPFLTDYFELKVTSEVSTVLSNMRDTVKCMNTLTQIQERMKSRSYLRQLEITMPKFRKLPSG